VELPAGRHRRLESRLVLRLSLHLLGVFLKEAHLLGAHRNQPPSPSSGSLRGGALSSATFCAIELHVPA
jgi:hypothetical protein